MPNLSHTPSLSPSLIFCALYAGCIESQACNPLVMGERCLLSKASVQHFEIMATPEGLPSEGQPGRQVALCIVHLLWLATEK